MDLRVCSGPQIKGLWAIVSEDETPPERDSLGKDRFINRAGMPGRALWCGPSQTSAPL
ncbi:hypothetical protein COLO4_21304 [Corchorus olitorius]|uniref:Uncharacterized protein n=1 Tax=Corchorus olitorius TaxID=93759 RepID=A0A1R3IU55_9ROSI|nr:hypothetical protein COLO4_21304 [Corchorus olitorius]